MQPAPSLASAITAVGLPNGPAHAHSGVELPAAAVAASGSSEGEGDDDRAVVKGSEDCMAGMRDEGDGMQGIMYAPMDLLARSRRVIQVYLLALRVVGVTRSTVCPPYERLAAVSKPRTGGACIKPSSKAYGTSSQRRKS